MKISVALCSYNGANYIDAQLASILNQDVLPDELVVGDDGSTDSSLKLIEAWIERFRKLGVDARLLTNDSGQALGPTKNFERVIKTCSGEYVFLSDQDDVWIPGKVSHMTALLQDCPGLLALGSDGYLIDETGQNLHSSILSLSRSWGAALETSMQSAILRNNFVPGMTLAVQREFACTLMPFPDTWLHDYWMTLHAVGRSAFKLTADPLVCYRLHQTNTAGLSKTTAQRIKGLLIDVPVAGQFWRRHDLMWTSASARLLQYDWFDGDFRRLLAHKLNFEYSRSVIPKARWRRPLHLLRIVKLRAYREFTESPVANIMRDLVSARS